MKTTRFFWYVFPVMIGVSAISIFGAALMFTLLSLGARAEAEASSVGLLNGVSSFLILNTVIAGLVVACVASYFFSKQIEKILKNSIRALSISAEKYSKGQFKFSQVKPKINEFEGLNKNLKTMADILKERIETITRVSNERETMLENMVEGIIMVDANQRIKRINSSAKKFLFRSDIDVVGKAFAEIVRDSAIRRVLTKAMQTGELVEEDIILKHQKKVFLQIQGIGLFDNSDACIGALIVVNDVTRIQNLEGMREEFVANVSHELKTPITLIKGFLETIFLDKDMDKEDLFDCLNVVQTHADRLESIIEDLLALSRIEQGVGASSIDFERQDIKQVLKKAIVFCEPNASAKQVNLVFKPEASVEANINPSLLEQAVINLVDNAVKYGPEQSDVTITLGMEEKNVVISVQDQGGGIDPKHLPRLFQRFYRIDKGRSRQGGGTGLGLAIVKHIAQAHGGIAKVASELGKGTKFSIVFPTTN